MSYQDNEILYLKFADSKVPVFKETKGKEFVLCGEDNQYPNELLYLYNKSAKHNAIINGKVNYIYGKGLKIENDIKGLQLLNRCNRFGEGLDEITTRCITDIEIFGGCYLEVIWDMGGGICDIIHKPFEQIRIGKDGVTFFYKESWDVYNRDKPVAYIAFDPNNRTGSQIFYYKEYRPGIKYYPLPGYLGAINYITCDIEISKYHLSAITNGMFPSKMISFNNGEPSEEGKRQLNEDFKANFTGAENSGKVMLVFGNDPAKAPIIQDLSATDLDKQFVILNDTVQQEIFSGHGITAPSLFGIMTAGKLGESTQLKESFDIFKATYAEMKQSRFEAQLNYLTRYAGVAQPYVFQQLDPIGFKLSEAGILQIAPKQWVLEQLGIDPTKYGEPLPTTVGTTTPAQLNDALTNLTGKQMQNLMRIVRKYGKGELTKEQAKLMMGGGYGLTELEIDQMLGENNDV